jgi:hypothetical protein
MFEVLTGKAGQPRKERELLGTFSDLKDAIALAEKHGMENCSVEMALVDTNKYFAKV